MAETKTTKTTTKTTAAKKATTTAKSTTKTTAAKKATTTAKTTAKTTATKTTAAKTTTTKAAVETKAVKQLKVTLVRSTIGFNKKQELVVKSLGLGKLHSSNVLPDNAAVRGMIFKVKHLVNVEEI